MTTSSTPRIPATGHALAKVLADLTEHAASGADTNSLYANFNRRTIGIDFDGDRGRFMALACAAHSVIHRNDGGPNSA